MLVYLTERKENVKSIGCILRSSLVRGAILIGYNTGSEDVKRFAESGYPLVLKLLDFF
jgi:DNA-binding LacI/PurR family transcriptional regulator